MPGRRGLPGNIKRRIHSALGNVPTTCTVDSPSFRSSGTQQSILAQITGKKKEMSLKRKKKNRLCQM